MIEELLKRITIGDLIIEEIGPKKYKISGTIDFVDPAPPFIGPPILPAVPKETPASVPQRHRQIANVKLRKKLGLD